MRNVVNPTGSGYISYSMRQGNSKTMTQDEHLDGGHRTNKSVNDQCNDDASTSSQRSSKNSRKKNFQPPPKMQPADRKTKPQSNKSAIGKALTSSKAKVPIAFRECSYRDKIGPSQRSTVGNQSDRVGAADDKTSDTDPNMTIITQQNNASLRDSIPSDVVDSTKNVSDTGDRATQRCGVDASIDFRASEKNATAINTDLQDDGATSGISPTTENSNNNLTAKTDTPQDHLQGSDNKIDAIAHDIEEGSEARHSPAKEGSCVKPLPKTDDPIARLNALRANISNALKEVKAVLDQHAPPQTLSTEDKGNDAGDEGTVQFRFVRRIRKKSVIKFDDEEIICNVLPERSTEGSRSTENDGSKILSENQTIQKESISDPNGQTENGTENKVTTSSEEAAKVPHEDSSTTEKTIDGDATFNKTDSTEKLMIESIPTEEKSGVVTSTENKTNGLENSDQSKKPLEVAVQMQPPLELGTQESVEKAAPADPKTPVKPTLKKEKKDITKPSSRATGKSDKVPKKQPSIQKADTERLDKKSVLQKESNKKPTKSTADSKIPIPKKPIQTINNKPKDLSKTTTEFVPVVSEKSEEPPKQIPGQISNTLSIVKESKEKLTVEKLDQKIPETVMKDVNERGKQTQKTIAESDKNFNMATELDNIETIEQVIKTDKQSAETLSSQKETPIKKPVLKFANVEAAAKEMLNQAVKNKKLLKVTTSENLSNEIPPTDTPKKLVDCSENLQLQKHDSESKNEPDKSIEKEPIEPLAQSAKVAEEKNIIKMKTDPELKKSELPQSNDMSALEKDVLTKPPVKLKEKRGSLTEPNKLTTIDKAIKVKRASIGSESELMKLKKQDQPKGTPKTNSFVGPSSSSINEPIKDLKTSAPSIPKPSSESAPANKVPSNTAPIKAAETTTSNCAQSETPAKNNTTLKVSSSSSLVESKSESLAEITQTPLNIIYATITQPIPTESNDADAKIATKLSQNVLDVGKPLTSSPDKLVSSESVGLNSKNSVTGSSTKMTVVKKDIVPSITPKQSLDELNDKVKNTEIRCDPFDNELVELSKISAEHTSKLDSLVRINEILPPIQVEVPITENGEVNASDIATVSPVQKPSTVSENQQVESPKDIQPQIQTSQNGLPPSKKVLPVPPKISPAKKELPQKAKLRKLQKQNSISEDSPVNASEIIGQSSASEDDSAKESSEVSLSDVKTIPQKQDNGSSPATELPPSTPTDVPMPEETTPRDSKLSDILTSTTTESSLSEGEKDATKSPASKKMRKTKKVVIRRIKRKLSRDGSQDEKAEPEVCEKPITEPPSPQPLEEPSDVAAAEEEEIEEPVVEEPPVPKGPRSCLVKRSYSPGQTVMYADRVRKIVKWKKAVVVEKITDISYKLEFDGQEKPAHISYIKKFTDKKVQFGGKEYLEIDYQQEYESSSEEEVYNIWARV